jgi:sugar/nucleoside kinase (ribokinase family)
MRPLQRCSKLSGVIASFNIYLRDQGQGEGLNHKETCDTCASFVYRLGYLFIDIMSRCCVIGLGDPVMDVLARVSHEFLASVTSEPGGCYDISPEEMRSLVSKASEAGYQTTRIPGGSAANVMKGLSGIMGPSAVEAHFIGMVGKDNTGKEYASRLEATGAKQMLLTADSTSPTATCFCLVTPDGQRTMRTCLGASLELKSTSQLSPSWCPKSLHLLHCEGYCLYRPTLCKEVMVACKKAGALVSMDLASFELVRHCKASLMEILESGLLDLVFANEEEAAEMAVDLQLCPSTSTHAQKVTATQDLLLKYAKVSIVSLGPKGCTVRASNGETALSPAANVKVVDTIGAGDTFTSGFLSAYLSGCTLQKCAEMGCAAGAEAVQVAGAEISPEAFARVRSLLPKLTASAAISQAFNSLPSSLQEAVEALRRKTGDMGSIALVVPICLVGIGMLLMTRKRS